MFARAMVLMTVFVVLFGSLSSAQITPTYVTEPFADISGELTQMSITVDHAGRPWVVYGDWYDYTLITRVAVREDGAWEPAGEWSPEQIPRHPTNIVTTSANEPIIGFTVSTGLIFATLRGGLGGTWEEESHGGGYSPWRGAIAIDPSDNVHCVNHWSYHYYGYVEYIKQDRATGSWTETSLGRAAFIAHNGSVSIDISGDVVHITVTPDSDGKPTPSTTYIRNDVREPLGNRGQYTTFGLSPIGVPNVGYYDAVSEQVMISTRTGAGWVDASIVSSTKTGPAHDIVGDANGDLHVGMEAPLSGELFYYKRDANGWSSITVDDTPADIGFLAVAVDASNNAHFVYHDKTTDELRYVYPATSTPVQKRTFGSIKALYRKK
jgi:hypothetical protein